MKNYFLFILLMALTTLGFADPLPANEVFKVQVERVDPNTFSINWQLAPGYYLYHDRIKINEKVNGSSHLGPIRLPKAEEKTDSLGQRTLIYRDKLSLPIAVLGEKPGESFIELQYQGCADDGFCYPPEKRTIKLTIDDQLALGQTSLEQPATLEETSTDQKAEPQTENLSPFANQTNLMLILTFFGLGLLLSFTPCILPMIPVLSGIIVGHGHDLTTRKAFLLSLSYVLSMSATYAVIGALVATLGSNLQIVMQSTWVIIGFSLVFIILAFSMFGYYELRLPVSWQAKLANISRTQAGGHYLSAAIMGSLSILILSPCVTPALIGALSYIAQTGKIALGSAALFFLGLGMGTPLVLIGTSAGKLLPKAGKWMNTVKAFFGVMLFAVAIYLLSRVFPPLIIMGFWATLLIISGIYCGAFTRAESHGDKIWQGIGLILFVYGLLVLIGASMGSQNPLQPLTALKTTSQNLITKPAASSAIIPVKSVADVQQALEKTNKPVMLDFYADWCSSCKIMEATTFKDPAVIDALKNFVVLKADITANDAQDKALLQYYKVVGPPTFLFFNREGQELSNLRITGETPANPFLKQLKRVLGSSKN